MATATASRKEIEVGVLNLRRVPKDLMWELREIAAQERKDLREVAIEALEQYARNRKKR